MAESRGRQSKENGVQSGATEPSRDGERPVMAAVQSCYIPWKGYFDLIKASDYFVVYDDVQFVKNHWHNRNRIRTANGIQWLTIPVLHSGKFGQTIEETRIAAPWARKHWATLKQAYSRAPFFGLYESRLENCYAIAGDMDLLSDVNFLFIQEIASILDLQTEFSWSRDHKAGGIRTDRLLALCKELGIACYLSGPSAKSYFEAEKFDAAGIGYRWMDYSGYPVYRQLHDAEFDHAVSILDLLFSVGPRANDYMKSFPAWKRAAA